MPKDKKNLTAFDKDLVGWYYLTDSIIQDSSHIQYNIHYFPKLFLEMDSIAYFDIKMELTKNAIIIYQQDILYFNLSIFKEDEIERDGYIKKSDDHFISLTSPLKEDTLFNIGSSELLRKYKRNYFLNNRLADDVWEVYKLAYIQHGLVLSLTDKTDRNTLSSYIVHEPNELIAYRSIPIVSMDNKPFRKFIRSGGFRLNYQFNQIDFQEKYE
ncbi:MAG: hypothetical protein K1X55_04970 [Chitinophagales bacterium]|nr:hypothetical protein [Chitinophagales bacterium]